jgi:hypothetical protein
MRRLVYRVGRRGAVLLFLAGLDVVISISLFKPAYPVPDTTSYVASLAPLRAWAVLWACCAVVCATNAFLRVDRVGFAAAMAVKVLWGLTIAGGAVTGHIPRGLFSASVWLTFAALVWVLSTWPEPPCSHGGDR